MVYFWMSLFMACTSMLLLASKTFNSLMTQVMLPILASMWCFCSASFSTMVRVAAVGVVVVVVAVLHLVHHLGEHGGHVVNMFVAVALVDHGVGEPVGGSVGGKGELRGIFMAALGDGLLHVDHDKLHVLLAPAALHGLQLLPLLGHFIIHATEGH